MTAGGDPGAIPLGGPSSAGVSGDLGGPDDRLAVPAGGALALDAWQTDNQRYLTAAVAWLRLLLTRLADRNQATVILPPAPLPEPPPRSLRWVFLRRAPAALPAPLPPPVVAVTDEQVAQAAAELAEIERQMSRPPALAQLARTLGLSAFERDVLLLCVAMELDTRIPALCARAQDDPARPYPTFALAMALFERRHWAALAPDSALRHWQLVTVAQSETIPLTASPLRAEERVVNYVKGLNVLDDRLRPLLAPLEDVALTGPLPPSQQQVLDTILRRLPASPADPSPADPSPADTASSDGALPPDEADAPPPVVQLLGPDPAGKRLIAQQVAWVVGRQVYHLAAQLLPASPAELEVLARLWHRESRLLPIALYLDAHDLTGPGTPERPHPPIGQFLSRAGGMVFLDARDSWPGLGRPSVTVDVGNPTPSEQRAAWEAALGPRAGDAPAALSSQFSVSLPTIHELAGRVLVETENDPRAVRDALWDACAAATRPRLDALAERIEARATWDDIVLPPADLELLRQIVAQVAWRTTVYEDWGFASKTNRGLGISALFAGESGTGKTMAAEVLANALRLNLYRIDLSAVVSKYIGETEENLRRIFDGAEYGGAILFFDEADALFGKRSEVKDSHDRYANIEINYLLQRMEAYGGLAILATNMKSALDQAFMRRLRFVVSFRFPDLPERREIWRRVFPARTPVDDLDYDWLARLNCNGGTIRNIALNAAFMAAQAGSPIAMPMLVEAARTEFRKLGRTVSESELRWPPPGAVA